jgi:hypothetical protein
MMPLEDMRNEIQKELLNGVKFESLAINNFKPTAMPIDPVTGLYVATNTGDNMRRSDMKRLIKNNIDDETEDYKLSHTDRTAKRLRAQLSGQVKYTVLKSEMETFTSTMDDDEVINENLSYYLYGEESKLGKHLAKLQYDLSELDRQGLQQLKYYPLVKKRVFDFKVALYKMEAKI